MKLIHFTILQISIATTLGILFGHFTNLQGTGLFLLPVGLVTMMMVWIWNQKQLRPNPLFEILSFCVFFTVGYANFKLRQPQWQPNHFSGFYVEKHPSLIQLKVKEVLKPSRYQDKYIAEIFQLNDQKTQGKVLLYIQKDSSHTSYKVDDLLLLSSKISNIDPPLNPHQFHYGAYLATLGVFHQIQISTTEIISRKKGGKTLKGLAESFRNHLIDKLKTTPIGAEERSIMVALILGQKQSIDGVLYKQYAAAGAVHILAVSGLHVGIILWILSGLFSPLLFIRNGKIFQSILIVILLWGFAFIAGLSPSVIRAVTMFSFFALAQFFNRKTASFQNLFNSYLFLILINPNGLFQVGFQLSYLAVFFILWLQPMLKRLYRPKYKIDKLFWDIFTVTIAAQLGVAPLSIYYFHQFPGLFFITNLVILPFLTLLLGYGILVLFLANFNILPNFLAHGYHILIQLLNQFIHWAANQDAFLFQDISFSFLQMVGFYALIMSLIIWWQKKKRWVFGLLGSILLILSIHLGEKISSKDKLIIFHKPRKSWMAVTTKDSIQLFQKDTSAMLETFPVASFLMKEPKKVKVSKQFPRVFSFANHTFLVMDSLGSYPKKKGLTIVLTESPKVNLDRMINSIQPKLIIADGNNFTSYVTRWELTCRKRNIPFYATSVKGAFILEDR